MATRKRVDSWVVTDDFGERVEPLIPIRGRPAAKGYVPKPGAGRLAQAARRVCGRWVGPWRARVPCSAAPPRASRHVSAGAWITLLMAGMLPKAAAAMCSRPRRRPAGRRKRRTFTDSL